MTIVGHIELYGFTGLYKTIEAGQVASMQRVVDTWFENDAYKKELMDAVVDPEHLLYNSGTWSSLSSPKIADGDRDYLKFYIDVEFESDSDKDDFMSDMEDAFWQEDIEISSGDVTAPWEYAQFHVDYDFVEDAE